MFSRDGVVAWLQILVVIRVFSLRLKSQENIFEKVPVSTLRQLKKTQNYIYLYIYMYVCMYVCMCVVGSTTWPHLKPCRVNNLATFVSLPFFKNILLSAGRMIFLKKNKALNNILSENCRVNNLATCPPKNADKNVAR